MLLTVGPLSRLSHGPSPNGRDSGTAIPGRALPGVWVGLCRPGPRCCGSLQALQQRLLCRVGFLTGG